MVVVHTGAGSHATLKLANIQYREALLDSTFTSHHTDLQLLRGVDSKHWFGILSNKEIEANVIEFEMMLLNSKFLGNIIRVTSEYGNSVIALPDH